MSTVRRVFMVAWPALACAALTAVIVAAGITVMSTLAQRDALAEQSQQIERILTAQNAEEATRAARLADALAEVDELTARRHDQLYAKVEALLARPSGSPPDPVTAVPAQPPEEGPSQ